MDVDGSFDFQNLPTAQGPVLLELAIQRSKAYPNYLQTDDPEAYEVYSAPEMFENIRQVLEKGGITPLEAKLGMMPANYVQLDESKTRQTMKLLEALDDHEDVQNVWSNFDVPDDYVEA